jgi:pyruvate dehydrogenase (quinone)
MASVAETIVDTLIAAKVRRIYGVVGDSLNALTEALRRSKAIEWIGVRHEEVAAFAAGADAHVTGELAVCAGSCGPGNMHLMNGLYDCHRSRLPVLAIAAQIPSAELGTGYFQETRPDILFKDCSHFCEPVTQPAQIRRLLPIAMRTALGRQGVSVLTISGDVALREVDDDGPLLQAHGTFPTTDRGAELRPADDELAKLAALLTEDGHNITILAGAGCAGAHDELVATAAALEAPIVHALRGKEHVEYDNPYDTGMTGLLGFSSGYYAIMDCNVLLMLGTDFPYPQFYPRKALVAQVDVRAENLGRRGPLHLGLVGDVRATLAALRPLIEGRRKSNRKHLDNALAHYGKARRALDQLATGEPGKKPIHPQYLTRVIDRLAAADAIFTCDVGLPTLWAARYLTMNGRRRLLGWFNHGSMASAMPQAIGAQVAFPDRQVISLSGDGGFTMLLGDLLTIRQRRLPVKIVVYNNGAFGFVELEMKAAGLLEYGTTLDNPNFADMARAMGLHGVRVEDPGELEGALTAALAHPGPAVIDVVVNRQELATPPTITAEQAKGFTLYMLKAVLSGRGDEVLDLAKTNLWR